MSFLCSVGILLHPRIPCRFLSSLWDFQKHPLCLKGALCSNKQNRQFNHCLELSKDALIRILCCLLKVSTGSSSFTLILSFFSLFSPSRPQRYAVVQTQLNHSSFFISHPLFSLPLLLQNNLTELKSFGAPVAAVTNVTAAVMVLSAPGGKVPKDRSWKAAKVMMAKVDSFLDSLINFNKENIPDTCLKAIQPYLQVSVSISPYSLKSTLTAHSVQCLPLGKFN